MNEPTARSTEFPWGRGRLARLGRLGFLFFFLKGVAWLGVAGAGHAFLANSELDAAAADDPPRLTEALGVAEGLERLTADTGPSTAPPVPR